MDTNVRRTHRSTRTVWRVTVSLIVTLAAFLALTTNGYADLLGHEDANDVTTPFDLKRASLNREAGNLTARVRTYDRLRARHFLTSNAFFVKFDTRGDRRIDLTLRMDYYEGSYPFCTLYDRQGFVRYGTRGVKGRHSFTCEIPFAELEATRHLRWRVVAEHGGLRDRAPNRAWFRH